MTSPAQTAANQINAQASSGPRTESGKAAAARNSTRHGLSSAFVVLPHEDRDEFDTLRANFTAEFAPSGEHETFLVDQLLHARWRLARIQRLEGAAFETMLDPDHPDPENPDARIVANMIKLGGNVFSILQRYAAAAERSYHKNYRELIAHRKQARQFKKENLKAELAAMDAYINAPVPTAAAPPATPGFHPTLGNLALRL